MARRTTSFPRRSVSNYGDFEEVSRSPTYISNFTRAPTYSTTVAPFQSGSGMVVDSTSSYTGITTPSLRSDLGFDESPNATVLKCYLYYRVYAEDSPVVLAKPMYSNDSFLGCILATSVAPPHNAANIKQYLCMVEGISAHALSDLFTSMSNESATDDDEHVRILDPDAPGSKPDEPMALVLKSSDIEVKSLLNLKKIKLKGLVKRSKPVETRYLYYLIYRGVREISPKQSIRFNGHVLGRIEADSVVPPHTVESLKRRIAKAESIDSSARCHLYFYPGSESPVADGPLSIFTGNCAGSTPNRPMALVYSGPSELRPALPDMPPEFSAFTKRIRGKQDRYDSRYNQKFIDVLKDEILYTDGQVVDITSGSAGGRGAARKMKVYRTFNGRTRSYGFVMKVQMLYIFSPDGL